MGSNRSDQDRIVQDRVSPTVPTRRSQTTLPLYGNTCSPRTSMHFLEKKDVLLILSFFFSFIRCFLLYIVGYGQYSLAFDLLSGS